MAADGEAFPMAHVFTEFLNAARVFQAVTSRPEHVSAVAMLTAEGHRRMLLGNMNSTPVQVRIAPGVDCQIAAESVQRFELEAAS